MNKVGGEKGFEACFLKGKNNANLFFCTFAFMIKSSLIHEKTPFDGIL